MNELQDEFEKGIMANPNLTQQEKDEWIKRHQERKIEAEKFLCDLQAESAIFLQKAENKLEEKIIYANQLVSKIFSHVDQFLAQKGGKKR